MASTEEIILRLILGVIIGGVVGFERESHGRAAGFRTQLIVCVASVLIMIVSENYYFRLKYVDPAFRIDPARIASGALIGIGFLGAGVIIKSGFTIRGLTTAASIWMVSAIGLAIGGGFYLEGITASAITLIALVMLRKVEKNIRTLQFRTIAVVTHIAEDIEETISSILSDSGVNIHSVDYEKDKTKGELIYSFSISTRNKGVIKDIFLRLGTLESIRAVRISPS